MSRLSTKSIPKMSTHKVPPFPWRQMIILALCRICEPIAFMSIFPYIYYMVKSFNMTSNDREIAMYAGMVTSAFAIAEFGASIFWGRLSDRIGRKPVLITGLAGTGLSVILFGFSKNLATALVARALGGMLNGNIGVLATTVAEVVTHPDHKPRGFSIMPFVWTVGSIVGASLGGTLAEPVKNFPSLFKAGSLFDEYPFLLPNLVCAAVVIFGVVVGFLFLEETHIDKKNRRDYGLELGQALLQRCCSRWQRSPKYLAISQSARNESSISEKIALQDGDVEIDTQSSSGEVEIEIPAETAVHPTKKAYSWRETFSSQVLLNICALGVLAFHTIAFEQLLPVLFSMPESSTPPQSPFKFTGGFALSTKDIGLILSVQGVLQMIAQLVIFPVVIKRIGPLWTFRIAVFGYPILYLLVPYLSLVPHALRYPAVLFVLVWKVTNQAFSYPSNSLMLVDHAPSPRVLGTLNGIAMAAASFSRAFGPTLGGSLQAVGLSLGISGLAWWACSLVSVVGLIISLYQRHVVKKVVSGEVSQVATAQIAIKDEETGFAPIVASILAESSNSEHDDLV